MNTLWRALADEAGLAAEHLAIGVTALGRANYAQRAYYAQAFFALSVGLERSAKLAIVVDHAVRSGGAFPSSAEMKAYGHKLDTLLECADTIASKMSPDATPSDPPEDVIRTG